MGISIVALKNTFTGLPAGLGFPQRTHIVGLWDFRVGSLEEASVNKITSEPATIVGSPVVENGRLIASNFDGLNTELVVEGERTFIAVAKASAKTIVFGSRDYTTPVESGLATVSEGLATFSNFLVQLNSSSTGGLTRPLYNLKGLNFMAATYKAGDVVSAYLGKEGTLSSYQSTVKPTEAQLKDPLPVRIGSWDTSGEKFVGNTEVVIAILYNKKLTEEEVNQVYNLLKNSIEEI